MTPFSTPLHARHTCGLPGCNVTVQPPARFCGDAHRASGNRMRAVTLRAFAAALALCGMPVTDAALQRWWRYAGLGVVAWFIESVTSLRWDGAVRRWRVVDGEGEGEG